MSRTRGLGAQHDQRRQDIAEGVLSVVAEQGMQAVSLSTVATRIGVSPGRVQYYFPTKAALLEAGFDQANVRASARITELVGGDQDTAPPRTLLTVVLTELVPHDERSRTHLRIRQAFAALALHDETIAERMRAAYQRLHHQDIAELLRRDRDGARLSGTVDPHQAAVGLVALTEGLAYYVLIGLIEPETARQQILDRIADLYT